MNRINRLYLVRHGQINGYEKFPVYGHTDVDITGIGTLQLEKMAERLRLAEIKAIYSSDLKRSNKGAMQIARYHDVPIYPLPELREMSFGDWEGLTLSEIRSRFPEEIQKRQADIFHYSAPGEGESIKQFSGRILNCFERITGEQQDNDFVIVAHGGVNRVILCNALGLDLPKMFNLHQDYGCLNIIDYFSDSTLVRLING